VKFIEDDVSKLDNLEGTLYDGIWCSFTAAYFTDLPVVLNRWSAFLKPGGWMALIEIDDLLGHRPLKANTIQLMQQFEQQALQNKTYDFRMGSRLSQHMQSLGFQVVAETVVADEELSFQGPASPEVLQAWAGRLDRMQKLASMAGPSWPDVRTDFLTCLQLPDHSSSCKVVFVLGQKP